MGMQVGDGCFSVGKRAARCKSSAVHCGRETLSGEEVAVKLEPTCTRHPQLLYEVKMYKALAGAAGIPRMYWAGMESNFNIMVTEMLGPSLEALFHHCNRKFSARTIMELGLQMLNRLEHVHARDYVHRDIRPETFLIGRGVKLNQVHMVGVALMKRYRHPKTKQHAAHRDGKTTMWNPIFASINAHMGMELSRRDDLESVGYVLAYFFRQGLPWQGTASSRTRMYAEVLEKKRSTPIEELCLGCPTQLATYLAYCRSLRFEQRPDYAYLRTLLMGFWPEEPSDIFTFDFVHDWTVRPAPGSGSLTPTSCPDQALDEQALEAQCRQEIQTADSADARESSAATLTHLKPMVLAH